MQRKFKPAFNLPSSSFGDEDIGFGGWGEGYPWCYSIFFTSVCNVCFYHLSRLGLFISLYYLVGHYLHTYPNDV